MPRVVENQPPTREELERRKQRRIERAERLERKDLTAQLTQVKTCKASLSLSLGKREVVN